MNDEQIKTALLVYGGRREARRAWSLIVTAVVLTICLFIALPFADSLAPRAHADVRVRPVATARMPLLPSPRQDVQIPPEERKEPERKKPTLDMPQMWDSARLSLAISLDLPGSIAAVPGDFSVQVSVPHTEPVSLAGSVPAVRTDMDLRMDFALMDNSQTVIPSETDGQGADVVYALSDVDRPPRPTLQVTPEYPYRARCRGVEGAVDLQFTVTRDGRVTDISVVGERPAHTFADAAVQAVHRWRFEPAMRQGRAVDVRVQVQLDFRL